MKNKVVIIHKSMDHSFLSYRPRKGLGKNPILQIVGGNPQQFLTMVKDPV